MQVVQTVQGEFDGGNAPAEFEIGGVGEGETVIDE